MRSLLKLASVLNRIRIKPAKPGVGTEHDTCVVGLPKKDVPRPRNFSMQLYHECVARTGQKKTLCGKKIGGPACLRSLTLPLCLIIFTFVSDPIFSFSYNILEKIKNKSKAIN